LSLVRSCSSSDVGCYGNYCGLQASCAPINEIGPELRSAPVDKLDGACFLHDICYNCANAAAGDAEKCCPDPQLAGLDKAACDRVFLERLKNDDLCGDGPLADRARCESTRVFAVAAFEAVLAGRNFEDELTGTGSPSATNNPNATCPAFSCPYVVSSSCFQVCGDDGCGGQCAEAGTTSACPADYSCDKYAHACFRNEANSGGDGSLNPVNAAPSRAVALGAAATVATAITLAALLRV
jgi:hypothetical protein